MKKSIKWGLIAFVVFLISLILISLITRLLKVVSRPKIHNKCHVKNFPFKTGDLIVVSDNFHKVSNYFTASTFIKFFTNSKFNHTAMVYVEPVTNYVYFWEMNNTGTRLSTFHEFFYKTNVDKTFIVRSLNKPVNIKAVETTIRHQWEFIFNFDICLSYYHRFIYPYLRIPFFKGHHWDNGKLRTCAHMTTEMYDSIGVFDFKKFGIDPSSVFARDYVQPIIDRKILPLANGYEFGPIILLVA